MNYLYVLTSTINDFYYEQFLLSATSLKNIMPGARLILLCDSNTKETFTGKRTKHEKIISDMVTVDSPSHISQIEVSRWLKTSMRQYIEHDFLFIDCDTIITDDLSSIFKLDIQFGACLDKHSLISNHSKSNLIIENDKKLGFTSYLSERHFNSGVIFCADTPETHKLFESWHNRWLYSKENKILRDQPSFNMAIHENLSVFSELDGVWNCQIAYNGLPYLSRSKIVHYFATDKTFNESPFLLASDEIFQKIKNTGEIPDDVLKLLNEPRAVFVPESRIITGIDMLNLLDSDFFKAVFFLKKKKPKFFNFLNKLSTKFKKKVKSYYTRQSQRTDGGIQFYE